MSHEDENDLDELSSLLGIEPEYRDNWGKIRPASAATKKAVLLAMGIEDAKAELEKRKKLPWTRLIEPALVVSEHGQPASVPVFFPLPEGREDEASLSYRFEVEDGSSIGRTIEGVKAADSALLDSMRYVRAEIPYPGKLPLGYHRLDVDFKGPAGELSGSMRLIVSPDSCVLPQRRTWGISMNLYALRSAGNWGFGDLSDLAAFVGWTGEGLGGGFVGINPLHAITNRMPFGISPYSSTSRLFSNFLYADFERVLGQTEEGKKALDDPALKGEIERLKKSVLIDYEGVAALKRKALEKAFDIFLENDMDAGSPAAEDFREFVKAGGKTLDYFATFMAIEEHLRSEDPGLHRWQDWPEAYRDAESPEVRKFKESRWKEVMLHQFSQWIVETQLAEASERASGMPVGLYGDLAIGSSGGGSDAWSYPEVFALGVCAGAPPDAFNLKGQNWGFPPLAPEKLRETGYRLLIETIRRNLRHFGALRIDHALGLFRLFWIPDGMSPAEGAYVKYPSEDLLRIIALESVRNGAAIIGEDLGTVGEEVRETLHRFGVLSYRLFYFERNWRTMEFLPPEAYPETALTAVTTHDLPTLYGYWEGRDIEVKSRLGLYPGEDIRLNDIEDRKASKALMLKALGKGHGGDGMTPGLCLAVHSHLARTPCLMVAVSLDDIIGVLDQQNMPGTMDAHPNWRQKTPLTVEELLNDGRAEALAGMFKEHSRGTGAAREPGI